MLLLAEPTNETALIQLAQREKACCVFFDFTLVIDAARVTFVIEVPQEASSILDDILANLA
jgi:hypothetical protein